MSSSVSSLPWLLLLPNWKLGLKIDLKGFNLSFCSKYSRSFSGFASFCNRTTSGLFKGRSNEISLRLSGILLPLMGDWLAGDALPLVLWNSSSAFIPKLSSLSPLGVMFVQELDEVFLQFFVGFSCPKPS